MLVKHITKRNKFFEVISQQEWSENCWNWISWYCLISFSTSMYIPIWWLEHAKLELLYYLRLDSDCLVVFCLFFLMGGELIDMNTIVNSFSSFHVQISKSIVMPEYYIFVTKRHKKKKNLWKNGNFTIIFACLSQKVYKIHRYNFWQCIFFHT